MATEIKNRLSTKLLYQKVKCMEAANDLSIMVNKEEEVKASYFKNQDLEKALFVASTNISAKKVGHTLIGKEMKDQANWIKFAHDLRRSCLKKCEYDEVELSNLLRRKQQLLVQKRLNERVYLNLEQEDLRLRKKERLQKEEARCEDYLDLNIQVTQLKKE